MPKLEYRKCMACYDVKKINILSEANELQLCEDCYEEIKMNYNNVVVR